MRVLVTGGTGYVGSHSAKALLDAGHDVRVLARSPDRVAPALGPLGVADRVEVAPGDVMDVEAVLTAMRECDAIVHAASVFSMDVRRGREMRSLNVRGTEIVVGAAARLGLDPIVYVSSELALLPPDGNVLTPDSPLKIPPTPYCRSKADSERVARRYQTQGDPVISVMPAAIWGPHDPHFGEGARLCTNVLKRRYPVVTPGGLHVVDVRDVAGAIAAAVEPGRGPRSYLVSGHYISLPAIVRTLASLTGRRIPFVTLPKMAIAGFGMVVDAVQRRVKARLPWTYEGIWVLNCEARCDDSRARGDLGIVPRDLRETFVDTVRWLVARGRLTPREAGRLAP